LETLRGNARKIIVPKNEKKNEKKTKKNGKKTEKKTEKKRKATNGFHEVLARTKMLVNLNKF